MKRLAVALAAAILCALGAPVQAQYIPPAALLTEIPAQLPDNHTGAITPSALRRVLTDMVNSFGPLNLAQPLAITGQLPAPNVLFTPGGLGAVPEPLSTTLGRMVFVDQYGSFKDFTHDDGPAIRAALAFGGQVFLGQSSYWLNTPVTVPNGVSLGCSAPPAKQHLSSVDYTNDACTVYGSPNNGNAASPTGGLLINNGTIRNVRVYQDNIHFAGNPGTAHALQAITANYGTTGTGIVNNGKDAIIEDVSIAGFNLGIQDISLNRGQLRHVLVEAKNCLQIGTIGDYLKYQDIECWPFYSANRSGVSSIQAVVSSVTANAGLWRITLAAPPSEAFVTGDEIYLSGLQGAVGANGKHTITVINSTTFDETGSAAAPVKTGNSTINQTYVSGFANLNDLWIGETFTGACFSGTRTIMAMWPGANAISADANATATTTPCTLTFGSAAFVNAGTPLAFYDPATFHGIGLEYTGTAKGVLANKVFVWGYDTAAKYDTGANGNSATEFNVDNYCQKGDSNRIGVWFQSGAFWNVVSGTSQTCGGVFALNQSAQVDTVQNTLQVGRVDGWVWGSIENDTGALTLSSLFDPNGISTPGQPSSDIMLGGTAPLIATNGTRMKFANVYFDTAATIDNLYLDNSSLIGGGGGTSTSRPPNAHIVTIQKFAGSGTYTPSANLVQALVECWGAGGGGGGAAGSVGTETGGGGGSNGGYSRVLLTAAQIGASQVVTIGAAGAAGTAGNNAGGAGGATSLGSLCVANGGLGGGGAAAGTGGAGGGRPAVGTGDETFQGNNGEDGIGASIVTIVPHSGAGGPGFLGSSGKGVRGATSCAAGVTANLQNGAGSGAECDNVAANGAGGAGAAGYARATEYRWH